MLGRQAHVGLHGYRSELSIHRDEADQGDLDDAAEAAVKIQSVWRGNKERTEVDQKQKRLKPWGYFTHTLGVTYASNQALDPVGAKRAVYLVLEDPGSSHSAQIVCIANVLVIIVSILAFILETVHDVYERGPMAWFVLEVCCTIIFTLEYVCRLAICDEAGLTRGQFLIAPMNLFDLTAILPFYLEVILEASGVHDTPALGAFRVVRLFRVLRMFKLGRYASGMRLMGKALQKSAQAISVLIFLLCMGVTVFSSALFTVERLYCPSRDDMSDQQVAVYIAECSDVFHRGISPSQGLCCNEDDNPIDFTSIIDTAWWSTVTMTSVGYGEVYPKTFLGKILGVAAMLVGMVLIALPVAIVGQKFQDVYESNDLEEAKIRASARMNITGERWSLLPSSDVCKSLRQLKVKDPRLAECVADFTSTLEEVWQQREQLMRDRKELLLRQDTVLDQTKSCLLAGMKDSLLVGHLNREPD